MSSIGSRDEASDSRDEAEFQRFFASSSRSLVGQAYALTGDIQEAQDLAQEALLRAWTNWAQIKSYESPEAWTRQVLHHLAIGRWRRLRLRNRHEASAASTPQVSTDLDAHMDVLNAVGRLPLKQRRTLVLHDYVGLTVDEIASELGVPAGTARSWLHRARRAVASQLRWDEVGPQLGPADRSRR
ncbi:MAG: RNA polymerase sigma factor [Acidimicrobiales bacterium]